MTRKAEIMGYFIVLLIIFAILIIAGIKTRIELLRQIKIINKKIDNNRIKYYKLLNEVHELDTKISIMELGDDIKFMTDIMEDENDNN